MRHHKRSQDCSALFCIETISANCPIVPVIKSPIPLDLCQVSVDHCFNCCLCKVLFVKAFPQVVMRTDRICPAALVHISTDWDDESNSSRTVEMLSSSVVQQQECCPAALAHISTECDDESNSSRRDVVQQCCPAAAAVLSSSLPA